MPSVASCQLCMVQLAMCKVELRTSRVSLYSFSSFRIADKRMDAPQAKQRAHHSITGGHGSRLLVSQR